MILEDVQRHRVRQVGHIMHLSCGHNGSLSDLSMEELKAHLRSSGVVEINEH